MANPPKENKVNDKVIWEDIYKLAKALDLANVEEDDETYEGLAKKLNKADSGDEVRPKLPYVDESIDQGLVNLTTDSTTPFGLKKLGEEGGDEIKVYQRFEFAYYNYRRTSEEGTEYVFRPVSKAGYKNSTDRYYCDYTRMPILHSMFLTDGLQGKEPIPFNDLIPTESFDEEFLKVHGSPSNDLVYNMIENRLHTLHRWWPKPESTYATKTLISPDLYMQIKSDNQCTYIPRVCPFVNMSGSTSNNGNNNTSGLVGCVPFYPNMTEFNSYVVGLRSVSFTDGMTLHNVGYDVYTTEVEACSQDLQVIASFLVYTNKNNYLIKMWKIH